MKSDLGIDEVIFHKRTPLKHERPKVNSLVGAGAKLAVDEICAKEFEDLGHTPDYSYREAMEKADVIVDCTPSGNSNKQTTYKNYKGKMFLAQGSEKGFGMPYALGINDERLAKNKSDYVQIVSCNTHSIARLLKCLSSDAIGNILSGDFVCVRRSNDISQDAGFTPSVVCGKHNDDFFGTHHARDVNDLYSFPIDLPIFSSALKTNTQYMHTVRFSITLPEAIDRAEIVNRFQEDEFVCMTQKTSANKIFSFGRDHGFYGRIYSQTVVCEPSLAVFHPTPSTTRVVGVAFTPQDGNSLMSSVAMCLYGTHGKKALHGSKLVACLKQMMLQDV